ncbi:unnamed protein product [Cuscuta campestris]|uniref:Reverse transcriptase zinc-binding domain-containing protein n=1 Tax=Cuscuta campestris TaxID=132261 RepID=A0A484N9U3_9ASTE|nr:unnamed protein product [Cuscuta campestris]
MLDDRLIVIFNSQVDGCRLKSCRPLQTKNCSSNLSPFFDGYVGVEDDSVFFASPISKLTMLGITSLVVLFGSEFFVCVHHDIRTLCLIDFTMEGNQAQIDMASLSLDDDEHEGLVFAEAEDNACGVTMDYDNCLVRRFLTERPINFTAMKNTMASLWRPDEGMVVRDLGDGIYVFQFGAMAELERVLDMCPWTFNNQALILDRLKGYNDPRDVPLHSMFIWVQVHGLKRGFFSERVAQRLGNEIGDFMESDPKNYSNPWATYLKIRVKLDVCKPLRKGTKMKREGEDCSTFHSLMNDFQLSVLFVDVLAIGKDFVPLFRGIGVKNGGLALFWKPPLQVSFLSTSRFHIDVTILDSTLGSWRYTGFYGHPDQSRRSVTWDLLCDLVQDSNLPWICGGDFNAILAQSEKRGGKPKPEYLMQAFRSVIFDAGLSELPITGYNFTYNNEREGAAFVEEKLDHFLTSASWRQKFPMAKSNSKSVWRKLWRVHTTPTIRNLIWRAANNILPVLDNLARKGMPIRNTCPLCQSSEETVLHLFISCSFARQVWTSSILGWYTPHVNGFVVWLEKILNLFNQRDQALVFHVLCSIWKTRNDRVWQGRNSTLIGTWLKAKAHFEEWWSLALPIAGLPEGATGSSWSRPHDGFVKFNIDASTGLVDDMMGVGFIARNELGVFLVAKNISFRGSYGPREVEAVAVKEALSWIKSKEENKLLSEEKLKLTESRKSQLSEITQLKAENEPLFEKVKSLNKELGILKSKEAVDKLLETTKLKGREGLGFDPSSSKRKGRTTFIPPKPTAKLNKQKGKEKGKPKEVPKKDMASLKNISTNEVILTRKRIRNIYEVIWDDVKEACLISKDKDEEINEGDRMKPTEFIPFGSLPLQTSQRNPDSNSAELTGKHSQHSNIPNNSNGDNSGNGDLVPIHPE